MVVGKETNSWFNSKAEGVLATSPHEAVSTLMELYEQFDLGSGYRGRGGYWTPVRDLFARLNPTATDVGLVSLNISKFDLGKQAPPPDIMRAQVATDLLRSEIDALAPDVLVFHTGPTYERWLRAWLPGAVITGDKWLATIESADLPRFSFRSHHPQYLNLKSRRAEIYSEIVARVLST